MDMDAELAKRIDAMAEEAWQLKALIRALSRPMLKHLIQQVERNEPIDRRIIMEIYDGVR